MIACPWSGRIRALVCLLVVCCGAPLAASGQGSFAPVIDARGASVEAVARLEQIIARQQADFAANVVQTIRKANQGGTKFGKFH